MKTWLFALSAATCLIALGCRNADPNTVLLERELRYREDQVYHLEDCLDQKQAELEACKRANADLQKRLEGGGKGPEFPGDTPAAASGSSSRDQVAPLHPPAIELPGEPSAPGTVPDAFKVPPGIASPTLPGTSDNRSPAAAPRFVPRLDRPLVGRMETIRPTASNKKVARITLLKLFTGGYRSSGGLDGDDGITVMIEPRDKNARLVDAAAPLSVVLLDESLRGQGEAARVAQWDFTAEEISGRFRQAALGRGIYLELLWPDKPPRHKNLLVYVEYRTDDGRKLGADQDIEVHLQGEQTQTWIPSPAPRSVSRVGSLPAASTRSDAEEAVILTTPPQATSAQPSAATPTPLRSVPTDNKPQAARPEWSPYR